MTALKHLLVHVNDEATSGHAMTIAAGLAKAHDARITVLMVTAPAGSAGLGLSGESAALAHQFVQAQREALLETARRLEALVRQRYDVPIDFQTVEGGEVECLQESSRLADLVVTSQRDPEGRGGLSAGQFGRLLLGAACPLLVVPHIGPEPDAVGDPEMLERALVAWADTRESARALRDALPLLAAAKEVHVVSFSESGVEGAAQRRSALEGVAAYLARHGIRPTTSVLSQGEPSVGERMRRGWVPDVAAAEAMLSHAADIHADFLVMGGYGHSRLRQLVLGGVTRTVLDTMTVPVLMSH